MEDNGGLLGGLLLRPKHKNSPRETEEVKDMDMEGERGTEGELSIYLKKYEMLVMEDMGSSHILDLWLKVQQSIQPLSFALLCLQYMEEYFIYVK